MTEAPHLGQVMTDSIESHCFHLPLLTNYDKWRRFISEIKGGGGLARMDLLGLREGRARQVQCF